ncbi:MAG: nuclear transport factor 2 family protein [Pseudomonadota bacterium]
MSFESEKSLVRAYHKALDKADWHAAAAHVADNLRWRGYHPFNEIFGHEHVVARFWQPLHSSVRSLHRREDIFFAGSNEIDGFSSRWVVSMGHLVGLFDAPWLGIAPTDRMVFLRYASFLRVEAGAIAEIAMFFDLPHLMMQAGLSPFAVSRGAHLVQPGPVTHAGLLDRDAPPHEGEATLAAINAMSKDLGNWDSGLPLEEELRRTWSEDMIWWGPAGIGATYTIPRYAAQHAGPFRSTFTDRHFNGHVARLAEGHFGGFFGWPNFTARLSGDYLGFTGAGNIGEFRVIDIYRRDGSKLAENWVFIDMPHFWLSQGVTILPDEASTS